MTLPLKKDVRASADEHVRTPAPGPQCVRLCSLACTNACASVGESDGGDMDESPGAGG